MRKGDFHHWSFIEGKTGCVQGCVLGPLVHGLSSRSAYSQTARYLSCSRDSFLGAYMDDVAISASTPNAVRAFQILQEETSRVGENINFDKGKTEVMLGMKQNDEEVRRAVERYTVAGFPLENIQIHPGNGGDPRAYGYSHLGIARGSKRFQEAEYTSSLYKIESQAEKLSGLEHAQDQWVLLNWVVKQKFAYLLRHLPPSVTGPQLERIDFMLRGWFTRVAGQPAREWTT